MTYDILDGELLNDSFSECLLPPLEELRREQLHAAGEIRSVAERVEAIEPAVADYNRRQVQLETGGRLAKAAWWFGGFVMLATVTIGSNWDRITGALRGWQGK